MSCFVRVTSSAVGLFFVAVVPSVTSAQGVAKFPSRPTPGLPSATSVPNIVQQTLPNGIRLAVVENHLLPIVAVRVGSSGGAFLDTPGKEGAWQIMTSSLREGTTTHNLTAIADAAADLGTTILWTPSGFPYFTTVRSGWEPSLNIVGDMLVHPAFPEDAFKRLQSTQAAAKPNQRAVAQRTLNGVLFGAAHPFGRSVSEASIRSVTRDDVINLATTYLRPQNTFVVVAGDVTPKEARAAVERAFAGWERGGTTIEANIPSPPARTDPTTIYLRDDPGAPVANIYTGAVIPDRGTSEGPAVELMNALIGGSTSSRMFDAFRNDRGLSYSPGSLFTWRARPQSGSWTAVVQNVPAAKVDTAVTELLRTFRDTRGRRQLSSSELDFGKSYLLGAFSDLFSTIDLQADAATSILQYALPLTFYNDYAGRLRSVTVNGLQAAAAKYVDPDHMAIVVVGDRAKLEAPLRATGIPVVVIDH
jgi:zinc protease